jgi:EAL domain-containing protein (putative c-di-GMP-specific phosphodiesterase class I)
LPVTTLKIDREFIADVVNEESSRNVVAAVVSLARAFSAKTVAEGAEDMDTVEILKTLGVDCVQGFVFGRPVSLNEAFGPTWQGGTHGR